MGSETENTTGFPFIVQKPVSSAVGSDGSFLDAACTRKNVLFAHSASPLPRILASQGADHDQTWRVCGPLSVESSPPSLRAVDGLCLKVSLGTWEPDPVLDQLFANTEQEVFPLGKKIPGSAEMGQAPTSQARPRDRPPRTTPKLGSKDSQRSGAYTLQVLL